MKPARPPKLRGLTQAGFTLLELVMVAGLVASLVAIALPAYSRYRERTRSAQAGTDIAGIAVRLYHYAEDARTFPDTLAEAGITNAVDPWGRPYQYLKIAGETGKGGVRKDKKLNPINSDFDLYSVGPDGVSQTQLDNKDSLDDIVRASNGGYIGTAADF